MKLTISISTRKTVQVLSLIIILLVFAHILATLTDYVIGHDFFPGSKSFVRLFNLDSELNIPTWFSSSMLLFCSVILAVITLEKKQGRDSFRFHWGALSAVFLGLAIDESASIHEIIIYPLRTSLDLGGIFYFSWIIPGIIVVIIFGLAYLKFLTNLPSKTKGLFILAGVIFVGGAIGIEMIGGQHSDLYGEQNISYATITMFEEIFEMTGIVIFIYALLSYIKSQVKKLQVLIQD